MPETTVTDLSWSWIALMAIVPLLIGILVSFPLWRGSQMTLGNIAGTGVIFGFAMALIMREYVVLDRITKACLDAGDVCWPQPSAFTRFAIYAFIGLIEVFALFIFSLKFEERVRRGDYAREWQR